MGPVDLGAGFVHAPALVSGELEPGQAAHVVVVRNRGTGDDRRHPVNVGVPDQQGPIAVVVSHLASFGPVGGVGHRSAHTTGNTGYARQDQADLCLQTPPSLVVSLVVNGHADSPLLLLGVGNCLALSEMEPGDPDTEGVRSDPARLLALALSRPQDALLAARSVLAGQPSAYDASLAHHAIGIVLRDRGDLPAAIAELRKGMRLARASGRPEREVDVQATLGLALAWTGRSQQGLAILNRAVAASRGDLTGRVLMRRASVLKDLGRFHEAHQDLSRALPYFRRAGDTVWEARSLTHRAEVFLGLGLPGRAAADYARAEELFATNGQEFEYAKARHNSGCVALIRGDLPEALTYLDEARSRYDELGENIPELAIDRCSALLAAGLAEEAAQETVAALSRLPPEGGIAYKRGGAALRGRHRRPGRRPPGRSQRAGPPGPPAVPDAGPAALGGPRQPGPRRGQVCRGRAFPRLAPVRRGGRRPARRVPGRRGDAGPPARRTHRAEPGERDPSRPASRARRAGHAAAGRRCPGASPGWPGPCRPTHGATPGPPSPPAPGGSTPSRSTRCGSAPPSCARTARRTVPSWPRWPSATRSSGATSAGCCSGASDGGQPRWPPAVHRRRRTRSWRPSSKHCAA